MILWVDDCGVSMLGTDLVDMVFQPAILHDLMSGVHKGASLFGTTLVVVRVCLSE